MVFNLAMALWLSRRFHRYEKVATHRQMKEAAKDERLFGDGDGMMRILTRGLESVKTELAVMEKVLGLIETVTRRDRTLFSRASANSDAAAAKLLLIPLSAEKEVPELRSAVGSNLLILFLPLPGIKDAN
jgi:hypothetical protein